ncbi:glycosyltransferase [Sunxiuqinia sp. A32]|uniref:glycosyltransferase n=1 Tax=Sunxiuqinia sp. A32 TaxID=3461496 RepID=UPI004045E67B
MSFANRYIERNLAYPEFVKEVPAENLGLVVVIPVYDEPELIKTLDSLAFCDSPQCDVEVLLVVNSGEKASDRVLKQNQETVIQVEDWISKKPKLFFKTFIIQPSPFIKKHAGAGMARKVGMDEAVRRFARNDRSNGVIVSLDADTLVASNYFIELEKHFLSSPKQVGACIAFKHRIDELTNERQKEGMHLYERYLHYYRNSLAFAGYPHAIYTIGSAFAVRVDAYTRQGGMNRKQAGEDFYFLHKLSQLGTIGEIISTCVYPSARISSRVPFGTGPVLQKWMDGDDSLLYTYRFDCFVDLKRLFDLAAKLFESSLDECQDLQNALDNPIREFLLEDNFISALQEIKKNSSQAKTFQKRFFHYFNAFKILKYINYAHSKFYSKQLLDEAELALKTYKSYRVG